MNKILLIILGIGIPIVVSATGANINYTGTLLPSRNQFWGLGTSTAEYKHLFVQDVTISGTCSGCSSAAIDLQDAYNLHGGDAEILTANNKNIIFALQDTATDANVIIDNLGGKGELQLANASTTNAVLTGYGRIGIGTTTPGTGLAINATSTILGNSAYLFGQLTLNTIWATSTTATTSIGSGGQGVNDGVGISRSLISGNLLDIGFFKATSTTATSTVQLLTIYDNLLTTDLRVIGSPTFDLALEVVESATSTFQGGISVIASGGLASAQGLTITGGHILSSGRIEITGVATSSFAGGINASSSIAITGKAVATPYGGCQSTGEINFAEGNGGCLSATLDTTISASNQLPNQIFRLWIYHDHSTGNSDLAWASSTFAFPEGTPTTTSNIAGMFDICTLTAAPTSTLPIAVSCAGPFDW